MHIEVDVPISILRYSVYMQTSGCSHLDCIMQKEFGMNELQGGLMGSLVYIGLVISSAFSGVYYHKAARNERTSI